MGHQHHWRDKPPEGRLFFNKTFDERYGDEEDMAHNSHWTSPEELQRLRVLVEKDPGYETSSNWPMLVEWCTSCSSRRPMPGFQRVEGTGGISFPDAKEKEQQ